MCHIVTELFDGCFHVKNPQKITTVLYIDLVIFCKGYCI